MRVRRRLRIAGRFCPLRDGHAGQRAEYAAIQAQIKANEYAIERYHTRVRQRHHGRRRIMRWSVSQWAYWTSTRTALRVWLQPELRS